MSYVPRSRYGAYDYSFDELSSAMKVRYLATNADIWDCDRLLVLRSADESVWYLVYWLEDFIRRLTEEDESDCLHIEKNFGFNEHCSA